MPEVLNAILDALRTGCAWDLRPHDFPPPGTVSGPFSQWRRGGPIDRVPGTLRRMVREAPERDPEPSEARLDRPSVKPTEVGGITGLDAGELVKGRKRPVLVDTLGLRIAVVVTSAGVPDDHGAKPVFEVVKGRCPRLGVVWADGTSEGPWRIEWVKTEWGWALRIIERSDKEKGFERLPKRWVVERTFGWLGRYRRLRGCE